MKDGALYHPENAGLQLQNRSSVNGKGVGRLRFHALGCRVDGGRGLPFGVCLKCADSVADAYVRTLMRIDRRVR